MGTIEISDLLNYAVPLLAIYIGYMHVKLNNAEINIAVNAAKDGAVSTQIDKLEESVSKLTDEFHDFIKSQK